MAEVFMAVRGQLNERGKSDLRKAGIVVVEVDDLTQAQFIRSSEMVNGDDMLKAAMNALRHTPTEYGKSTGASQRNKLAWNLINLVDSAHAPKVAS